MVSTECHKMHEIQHDLVYRRTQYFHQCVCLTFKFILTPSQEETLKGILSTSLGDRMEREDVAYQNKDQNKKKE